MVLVTALVAAAVVPGATPSPEPAPTRYIDPATVTPGLIGFVIFVLLAVATFLLWRSMNKQLKKIDFDEGGEAPGPTVRASPTDEGAGAP